MFSVLEKELLGHVKRLSEASEVSAKVWNALEVGLRKERAETAELFTKLVSSQNIVIDCLCNVLSGSATLESELEALSRNAKALIKAEEKLNAIQDE